MLWGIIAILSFLVAFVYIVMGIIQMIRKNKNAARRFMIGFIAFAVFIIALVALPDDKSTATSTNNSAAQVGQEKAIGSVSFTALEVQKTSIIGDETLNKKTDGEFVIVKLTVKNNDKVARVFDSHMFKIKSADGAVYDADASALIYMGKDNNSMFIENVNPGLSRTGYLVFEMPKGVTGLQLQCSSEIGSSDSEFVSIDLGI